MLNELAKALHDIAVEHGWWEKERNPFEIMALIHSEVSEAVEAMRHAEHGEQPSCHEGLALTALEEELADIIIRVLDFSHSKGINIDNAVRTKMEFNRRRTYRHGGKTA